MNPIAIEISADMRGKLNPGRRQGYALAGNATITIQNPATGNRFTYRIQRKRKADREIHFVTVLTGPDNQNSYEYLGTIFDGTAFRMTRASRITQDAPSAKAFIWLSTNWENARIEVWHEGACGRCGRKLTVPESIETGLGPTCAARKSSPLPVIQGRLHV